MRFVHHFPFGHRCRFDAAISARVADEQQGGEAVPKVGAPPLSICIRSASKVSLSSTSRASSSLASVTGMGFPAISRVNTSPSVPADRLIAAGILAGSRRLVRRVDPGYQLMSGTTAELIPGNGCLFSQAGASWKHIKTRRWRALTNLPPRGKVVSRTTGMWPTRSANVASASPPDLVEGFYYGYADPARGPHRRPHA